LAVVVWLRGCMADSRLVVVLKVGLYEGAVESEAVACQVRSYGVKAGLDDLTTFDNYDWNHWVVAHSAYLLKISFTGHDYFVEALPNGPQHMIYIMKTYQHMTAGERFNISFDHRSSAAFDYKLHLEDEKIEFITTLPASPSWQNHNHDFFVKTRATPTVMRIVINLYSQTNSIFIDNLRVKFYPSI
jgi:hypothetical protein